MCIRDSFKTSNQENYGAPGEDAYQREQTPSRAQPDVRHVDPSHFKTSNQENYGAPGEDAYQREQTPSRAQPDVRHVDPSQVAMTLFTLSSVSSTMFFSSFSFFFFFFNDTATTEIYTILFVGSVRCV
eukprot:TRINITY_DN3478_c0_g1_i4.p1 TRINITY_DN3478_c0_g1~~TRINITY_DN3478_c0_g1_i4.p1  ORF type:complete len:128 (-),score=35.09 TRINITY_DN3478_c0_g1_i4:153-536(-)